MELDCSRPEYSQEKFQRNFLVKTRYDKIWYVLIKYLEPLENVTLKYEWNILNTTWNTTRRFHEKITKSIIS